MLAACRATVCSCCGAQLTAGTGHLVKVCFSKMKGAAADSSQPKGNGGKAKKTGGSFTKKMTNLSIYGPGSGDQSSTVVRGASTGAGGPPGAREAAGGNTSA